MFLRIWQYIKPTSQPQNMCNHVSPGPPHLTKVFHFCLMSKEMQKQERLKVTTKVCRVMQNYPEMMQNKYRDTKWPQNNVKPQERDSKWGQSDTKQSQGDAKRPLNDTVWVSLWSVGARPFTGVSRGLLPHKLFMNKAAIYLYHFILEYLKLLAFIGGKSRPFQTMQIQ